MDAPSPREYRVARWLFWVLIAVMVATIYRDIWSDTWLEVRSAGLDWWQRAATGMESMMLQDQHPVALPSVAVTSTPDAEHSPPQPVEESPQTVGDLIAGLQQQDDYSDSP